MENKNDSPPPKNDSKNEKADAGSTSEESERVGGGISMSDTLKKLFTAGVSAAFMTEESIRSFVSEMKLPKETLNVLLQGAAKSKEELMSRVTREIIGIISKIDFVKEASRFAEDHKFKISAEIEIIRKEPRENPPPVTEESSLDVRFSEKKPQKS
jgi:hypothetical protein